MAKPRKPRPAKGALIASNSAGAPLALRASFAEVVDLFLDLPEVHCYGGSGYQGTAPLSVPDQRGGVT